MIVRKNKPKRRGLVGFEYLLVGVIIGGAIVETFTGIGSDLIAMGRRPAQIMESASAGTPIIQPGPQFQLQPSQPVPQLIAPAPAPEKFAKPTAADMAMPINVSN